MDNNEKQNYNEIKVQSNQNQSYNLPNNSLSQNNPNQGHQMLFKKSNERVKTKVCN